MFSSCCSPITLIAAATSRTFSTRLLAVTITASRSVAPAAVEAASGAVDPSASWASAVPAVESATAAPMARASRERREHPVVLDAVMVVLPGSVLEGAHGPGNGCRRPSWRSILIRDHDPNQRIVNTSGKYCPAHGVARSEEHTSELQSLMRNSYAVFCLQKKK